MKKNYAILTIILMVILTYVFLYNRNSVMNNFEVPPLLAYAIHSNSPELLINSIDYMMCQEQYRASSNSKDKAFVSLIKAIQAKLLLELQQNNKTGRNYLEYFPVREIPCNFSGDRSVGSILTLNLDQDQDQVRANIGYEASSGYIAGGGLTEGTARTPYFNGFNSDFFIGINKSLRNNDRIVVELIEGEISSLYSFLLSFRSTSLSDSVRLTHNFSDQSHLIGGDTPEFKVTLVYDADHKYSDKIKGDGELRWGGSFSNFQIALKGRVFDFNQVSDDDLREILNNARYTLINGDYQATSVIQGWLRKGLINHERVSGLTKDMPGFRDVLFYAEFSTYGLDAPWLFDQYGTGAVLRFGDEYSEKISRLMPNIRVKNKNELIKLVNKWLDAYTIENKTNEAVTLEDFLGEGITGIFLGHTDSVNKAVFMPDGKTVLSCSSDKTLKLWDLATRTQLKTFIGHTDEVVALAVLPDGKTVVSGSKDSTIKLWDIETGHLIRTITGLKGDNLEITPDGKGVLFFGEDETLKLFDLATGKEIRTVSGRLDWVHSLAISPDGRLALAGDWDNLLRVWNLSTGEEIATISGHQKYIASIAVATDGKTALTGSGNIVMLWDLETGKQIRTLKGHSSVVDSIAVMSDGKTALSGGRDHTLILWDLATGKKIKTLYGYTNWIKNLAISSDEKNILSVNESCTFQLWKLN